MFDVYLLIDIAIVLALTILAFAVLQQGRRSETSLTFIALAFCVAIWITANYISNDVSRSSDVALRANYFVFFFSYFTAVNLLHFAISISADKAARRLLKYVYLPAVLVGLLAFTPLIARGVSLQDNVYAVQFGAGLPIYFIFLISFIIATFVVLARAKKRLKGLERERVAVMNRSFAISLPFLVVMLFILPVATGWFGLTNIGILPMAALVAGMYYAVFKHKLFDLRIVVIRSIGYLLSLGLILIGYALLSAQILHAIGNNPDMAFARGAVNAVLIMVAALVYGPAKQYFDRTTNSFFFRDAYNAQELLNQVNRTVVTNTKLEVMLKKLSGTVNDFIKPTYTTFSLKATAYTPARVIGSANVLLNANEMDEIEQLTSSLKQRVILAQDLEENTKLAALLQKHDIALLARLTPTLKYHTGTVGFMFVGYKRSGNNFSKQDLDVIRIISGELIIAIENALRFEEIDNFNTTLQAKVTEATRKLRRTNEKLKALDEAKDDFVSMASHQLRTPLTSIKGYTSMVLEGDAGKINATQRKLLEQSFSSSQRMVYLIADLLNVSRLKTGKFIIEEHPVNIAEVVQQEIGQLKETAAGRSLELNYDMPADFPSLMLDETKTRQVIMNFIDNAIYYTPAGGHISVKVLQTAASVEFRVADDGIGVPKAEQPHLFTKFYRAGNARTARPDGTGLGLFMAKKVIIAQGGALIFETQEGKGSTFGFVFSKTKIALDAAG